MKKKSNNKKWVVAIIAILTAVVGVFIALGTYLKKKAEVVGENLDYDADFYDEEEDYYDSNANVNTDANVDNNESPSMSNNEIGVLEDNDVMPDGKENGEIL